MPQIYIAAIITTAVSVAVWGGLFWFMSGRYRRLASMALLALPLSFFINLWVKRPLFLGVAGAAGLPAVVSRSSPVWFILFAHFLAPVTEEVIKLLPLPWSDWRRPLRQRGGALWAGMYLGAGFGLSEIWYLAWSIARVPAYSGFPFWHYTGFFNERLLTVYAHAVMTAVAVTGVAAVLDGDRMAGLRGLGAAVGLHALVNLTALLYQMGFVSALVAQAGLIVTLGLLTLIFQRLFTAARELDKDDGAEPPQEPQRAG